VLYELACGTPPNDIGGDGDPLQVLRRIRESVPPPASRVRQHNAAAFAGDAVPRSMLSDLDCVLARALEKDPTRRYPTIAAFADDLRRLLKREPIEARPATRRYRAARFAQRNRVLVGAAALVALAMILGIVGLSIGLAKANRAQREASNQTDAQRAINRFLTDDLLAAASPDDQGQNITALELLRRASARVDARFSNRPLIAASIHHTLGVAYTALGAFDESKWHLDQAIALRTAESGGNAPDTVRSEIALAGLLARRQ
jgi:serine/threonine-protein kinase